MVLWGDLAIGYEQREPGDHQRAQRAPVDEPSRFLG